MFNLFFISIIAVLILTIIYLITIIHKFSFIKNIPNKKLSWLISILPITIIFLFFNYVNSLVIIIHLIIFFFLTKLIFYLIKKVIKKEFTYNTLGIISIIITLIYLSIGAYLDYHVFETKYELFTKKELGQENFRIIQISDSHVGTTFDGNGFYKHMEKISKIDSDIFVITGDFVDDDTTYIDMKRSCEALSLIKAKYGVYFIYGNHDKGYFDYRNFKDKELREELEKNNVIILEDDIININDYIYLIGRNDKTYINRKSIQELTKDLDKDKYIIDLNHQPNDYDNEINNVDLVLSGHSHGGQLFPLGCIGLITGSNDEFKGLHKRGNTDFIVNTGISDWAVDFKTGTKSEYVIVDIKKN